MFRRPLSATLFPYTTLFRSVLAVDLRNPHWQENRPVVHAVEIDTGFENVRVACQTHGGQKSAVGSAPETDPLRINVVERLQKFRTGDHILVFGCAAPHRLWRLAK